MSRLRRTGLRLSLRGERRGIALLMVPQVAVLTLIGGFLITYAVEKRAVEAGLLPAWYMSLRLPLTLGALASLLALAAFAFGF